MSTSKSHLDYWKSALRKQKLPRGAWETDGRTKDWEAYLQHRGRREWFNLGSPNKDVAAAKAREIWFSLRAVGWEETRMKFKPDMIQMIRSPSIGAFLKAIEDHSTLRRDTFAVYAKKLRTLTAGIRHLCQGTAEGYQLGTGSK